MLNFARRPIRFSRQLGWVIASTLLPVLLFSGWLVLRIASQMRESQQQQLITGADGMAFALDRELLATFRTLQALAGSERLELDDLDGFRQEAARVAATQSSWLTVILLTPDGIRRVQLGVDRLAENAPASEMESLLRVVATQRPVVGSLSLGPKGNWGFAVRVPVIRGGMLRYVLTAVITPTRLQELMTLGTQSDELIRTVVDDHRRIAFRTRQAERFVGLEVPASFAARTRAELRGFYEETSMEGTKVYVAFSRSSLADWTSAVAVPVESLNGPFRRSVFGVLVLGILFVLASGGAAYFISLPLTRGLDSAATGAHAVAEGKRPDFEASGIFELEALRAAMIRSADLLRRRNEERDEHLARERAVRSELEQAVRARDEFLSLASHELKTPLTSLTLHTRLLERGLSAESSSEAAVRRFLEQNRKQTSRLSRLVDDMLDISRITAGKLALEVERFELSSLASEVVSRLSPQLEAAGCTATLRAPAPVEGEWDRDRLDQVLTNLLTNASRYAPGSSIEISVRAEGEEAVLEVRDHGPGIKPEDHDRIFRKFERAVAGSDVSGLGLGLFITAEIVRMHQGSIRVENASGGGARFVVRLPSRRAA